MITILKSSESVGDDYQIDAVYTNDRAAELIAEFRRNMTEGADNWEAYSNRIEMLMASYHIPRMPLEDSDRRVNLCCIEFLKTRGVYPEEFVAEQPFDSGIDDDGSDTETHSNLGDDQSFLGRFTGASEACAAS